MSYYKIFGLEKEPFSISPDPRFFYHSLNHTTILKRLEIAIRLKKGLSLVLGDVGIGKTTLLRTLIQAFKDEDEFIFHLILDPGFKSEYQFFSSVVKAFGIGLKFSSTLDFKEALQKYLFQKGVEENKTIVLLIDEGQKLTPENLEFLRILLNFETNEYKLLQLVIMGQLELLPRIRSIPNFSDRVALKCMVMPFDRAETKEMIEFRLKEAGFCGQQQLFTDEAIGLIYEHTGGYPRKINLLCHDALETAVMRESPLIDKEIVDSLIAEAALL